MPNLNGTWAGSLVTYYPNHEKTTCPCRIVIWQDMHQIGICVDTPLHKWDSKGASIVRVADGWILSFHYSALRKLKRPEDVTLKDGKTFEASILEKGATKDELHRDYFGHHSHVGCARVYIPDPRRWPIDEEGGTNRIKVQFYTDSRRTGFIELQRKSTLAFPVSPEPASISKSTPALQDPPPLR